MLEKIGLKFLWPKILDHEEDINKIVKTIETRCNDIDKTQFRI